VKQDVLARVKQDYIDRLGLAVVDTDELKPWGAYYRFSDGDAEQFITEFFPDKDIDVTTGSLSPKLLVFEPGKKLSLQYHNRRGEHWRVIEGEIEVALSETDEEGEYKTYKAGDTITYGPGIRHRAGGLAGSDWAIVAEIWEHTVEASPTDEDDIVRLKDDFGRK